MTASSSSEYGAKPVDALCMPWFFPMVPRWQPSTGTCQPMPGGTCWACAKAPPRRLPSRPGFSYGLRPYPPGRRQRQIRHRTPHATGPPAAWTLAQGGRRPRAPRFSPAFSRRGCVVTFTRTGSLSMPLNGWEALDPLDHWGLTELPNRWTSSTSLLRESIENPKETQHPRQAGTLRTNVRRPPASTDAVSRNATEVLLRLPERHRRPPRTPRITPTGSAARSGRATRQRTGVVRRLAPVRRLPGREAQDAAARTTGKARPPPKPAEVTIPR